MSALIEAIKADLRNGERASTRADAELKKAEAHDALAAKANDEAAKHWIAAGAKLLRLQAQARKSDIPFSRALKEIPLSVAQAYNYMKMARPANAAPVSSKGGRPAKSSTLEEHRAKDAARKRDDREFSRTETASKKTDGSNVVTLTRDALANGEGRRIFFHAWLRELNSLDASTFPLDGLKAEDVATAIANLEIILKRLRGNNVVKLMADRAEARSRR